ncbi:MULTISPECIES: hypothetical protein [Providencia]|uniref:HK97 gp10 family phage protein n=1 Tax=Providencia alcalifaciens TaxID=126385 RepID=A0A4R3NRR6_9GAMM|nr:MULTISPECIES: hypothetical protein [Providencia]MTC74008.1 hypothetical protein [Providencia sp. wls1919]ETT00222.1 hypothetical protein HMPREF1568_3733 [Providencia alcalifaciens PAL-3]EUC98676.1 hypothetical protein HMPREF1566_1536 [Providencia alcalifaciens PAL-1]MBG5882754.1 hypothetical protein [Providencia alcalifaciens]MTC24556.1 hypothetical protein [Providencia sp. wls1938]
MTDSFMKSVNLFVEKSQSNMEAVVKKTGVRILAQLVQMSPVGNPDLWKVNQTAVGYNQAVFEHNEALRKDPNNLTLKNRQLKKRARVNDSMDIKAPPGYTGGRFRGNWQVTFDVPADGETGRVDKSGNMTKAVGNYMLEQFKVGMNAIYFTNNVPYAYRLEMGHSKQAPNGMIAITAENVSKFFRDAIAEMK